MTRALLGVLLVVVSGCGRTPPDGEFDGGAEAGAADAGARLESSVVFTARVDGRWHLYKDVDGGALKLGLVGESTSVPNPGCSFQGRYYFSCERPGLGSELCVSDGTPAGTGLFLDLTPGPDSSSPFDLRVAGGRLYLVANSGLWESDGTVEGTQLVLSGSVEVLDATQDALYFYGAGELWKVAQGHRESLGAMQQEVVLSGKYFEGRLYFVGFDPEHGREPWRTTADGGLEHFADLIPGRASGADQSSTVFVEAGGRLYFVAHDGHRSNLYVVAPHGAAELVQPAGWGIPMLEFEGRCVFFLNGQIWSAGLDGVRLLGSGSHLYSPVVAGGRLYFLAGETGALGLWRLEADGPRELRHFTAQPFSVVGLGESVYLRGASPEFGEEAWVMTGDEQRVIDVLPGPASSYPAYFRRIER